MTERIFTQELLQRASTSRRPGQSLLHRWATWEGDLGFRIREQIEAAFALVPEPTLSRLRGQLGASTRRPAMGALATALFAKTLVAHGWTVEHEPRVAGGTPDFLVTKRPARFVVEMKQVEGSVRMGDERSYEAVCALLNRMQTRTPLHIVSAAVAGGASLKGFRRYLERVLASPPAGRLTYSEAGVVITFEVMGPYESSGPALGAYSGGGGWIDDFDDVADAIDDALKQYQCPLIVALDMLGSCLSPFRTVEEVLLGREQIVVPIATSGGRPPEDARMSRAADGMLVRRGRDGARARERLIAALPFQLDLQDEGFRVHARLMANPFGPEGGGLEAFHPIPCLLVEERGEEEVRLGYTPRVPGGSKDEPAWSCCP